MPTSSPRAASIALLLIAALLGSCGAEGQEAPATEVEVRRCASLDEHLAGTLDALDGGQAESLAAALRDLEARRPEIAEGLVGALLAVAGELWRNGLSDSAELLDDLSTLLDGLEQPLAGTLRLLADDANHRALVDGVLVACPDGTSSTVVARLAGRPTLIRALGDAVRDPTVTTVLTTLESDDGSGRAGFVALIETVVVAVSSPSFQFDDLIAIVDPLFDLDSPPFDALVPELRWLLTDDPLTDVRRLTECLRGAILLPDGTSGTRALGRLLFDLLTSPDVRLGDTLRGLDTTVDLLADPRVQSALVAVTSRLRDDARLRMDLTAAFRFLLADDVAPGAFSDLATLVENGLVDDLLALLADVVGDSCTAAPDMDATP